MSEERRLGVEVTVAEAEAEEEEEELDHEDEGGIGGWLRLRLLLPLSPPH